MVDRTRLLWKRQAVLNRERFDMPAYDVMQEDESVEVAARPVHSRPHQHVCKLLVHAPSDPGMLSYITQPDVTSPGSIQSPSAIKAGWASQTLNPNRSLDENVPPHRIHHGDQNTRYNGSSAAGHRRVETWSHDGVISPGTVKHERSASGGVIISGPSAGSPRHAHGYQLPGPSSAWLPPPPSPATTAQATQHPRETASLISWDEPLIDTGVASQGLPASQPAETPLAEASQQFGSMGDWSLTQQLPYGYSSDVQRTHSSQHAAPAQQMRQQAPGSHAGSCRSSGSGSPETAALVPQAEADQSDDAAAALPERMPAFTQPRGPLKPEHSFEVNAIW